MTRTKEEVEALLAELRGRGDPLGVLSDPELQLTAVDAAYARYVSSPTAENMHGWLNVVSATRALGTNVDTHMPMRTKKPLQSEFWDTVHPVESDARLVEPLSEDRLVWLVEIRTPNPSLEGGASYDWVRADLIDLTPVAREGST